MSCCGKRLQDRFTAATGRHGGERFPGKYQTTCSCKLTDTDRPITAPPNFPQHLNNRARCGAKMVGQFFLRCLTKRGQESSTGLIKVGWLQPHGGNKSLWIFGRGTAVAEASRPPKQHWWSFFMPPAEDAAWPHYTWKFQTVHEIEEFIVNLAPHTGGIPAVLLSCLRLCIHTERVKKKKRFLRGALAQNVDVLLLLVETWAFWMVWTFRLKRTRRTARVKKLLL